EFWMYRGYTLGALFVLLASLVWQYFERFRPQLRLRAFLPVVLVTLVVETLLVMCLLMPIVTTVVWYHSSFRRGRLLVVLCVGLASTLAAVAYVLHRHDPIVSYMTRERVRLRTAAAPKPAHRNMLEAARTAWRASGRRRLGDKEGRLSGEPLERAHAALEKFYKQDEA